LAFGAAANLPSNDGSSEDPIKVFMAMGQYKKGVNYQIAAQAYSSVDEIKAGDEEDKQLNF